MTASTPVPGRRRWAVAALGLAAALLAGGVSYAAYAAQRGPAATSLPRASGLPANMPTQLANMMQLSPLGHAKAPGFTLTDQRGHTLTLASLRGKVVVLEFMDPHCTDICPIVSQEFIDAYHDLGPLARSVVFAAVNVNAYHASVRAMATYSTAHHLTSIPGWHFLTGPVPALRAVWRSYHIAVMAPSPDADVVHTSAVYFIDAQGNERYLASPMADHTQGGSAYLPLAQIARWGHGIATVAGDLAR